MIILYLWCWGFIEKRNFTMNLNKVSLQGLGVAAIAIDDEPRALEVVQMHAAK